MIPKVIIHVAVSLDGHIDRFTPETIASLYSLYYELASRWKEDATLAGADTILLSSENVPDDDANASEPQNVDPNDTRPILVIPDSRGRVRIWHYLRTMPYWRIAVALCSKSTPQEYLDYLQKSHVDCIIAGDDHVDLRAALEELNARYGVKIVRVDSGGILNGVLLRAGLVDEVSVLIHSSLVGGMTQRSFFRAPDLTSAEGVIGLRLMSIERPNEDIVWLRYGVTKQ